MLKKLLKYDMKSMVHLLVPLSIAVVGTTIAGTAALRIMQTIDNTKNASWILTSALALIFVSTILALLAFSVFSEILIMYRYYTHLFTDEGYLTFTLPVKTSSILNSKLINALIWSVYTVLVVFFCIFLYVIFGTAEEGLINSKIFTEIKNALELLTQTYSAWVILKYIVEIVVIFIISLLYGVLSIYLALTIGSIIAKKHKILAAIGIYYGLNTVMSIFVMIVNFIFTFTVANSYQDSYSSNYEIAIDRVFDISFFINAASFLVFSIVAYFVTRHLLKNKLNLS
ncbi:MAG: hypothetical protein KIC77_10535 [Clostridiales bacterium]|jgi:hypothetical protein ELI_0472|nr:hypothetical protein [Clostridiales bacterium]